MNGSSTGKYHYLGIFLPACFEMNPLKKELLFVQVISDQWSCRGGRGMDCRERLIAIFIQALAGRCALRPVSV